MKTNLSTILKTARRWLIITMLLSAAGSLVAQNAKQAWVQRFGSTFGSSDLAHSIARDSAGNAIVAGDTDEGGLGLGILVIKYSAAGEGLWTNRYNIPGDDHAAAVAVDGSNNVFVTGSSGNGYVTLAFSGLGVPLWTNQFNGPGGVGYSDSASALALEEDGNVFVTGRSHVNSSAAFATLKYSGAGVPLWTNIFVSTGNGYYTPTALAADNAGNVVVTGQVEGPGGVNDFDYVTIKYASNGVPMWTNRCSGEGLSRDIPTSLGVDGSGNVFVTGSSGLTIKYSPNGVALWTNHYPGVAWSLAVDSDGNVAVTGARTDAFNHASLITVKYSPAGAFLWHNEYDAGFPYDRPQPVVAASSNGDFFVTGYTEGSQDHVTIKYSAAGSALWTRHYGTTFHYYDHAPLPGLVIDQDGNALVAGYSFSGTTDFVTRKYASDGAEVWTNSYNGNVNVSSSPSGVAVDPSGNIIVTGGGHHDYATIKFSPSGVALWTNYYDGPARLWDSATALAIASNGNIFVTGESYPADYEDVSPEYLTVAYTGAGVPLWTNRYESAASPVAIVADSNGDVIVSGNEEVVFGDGGWVTIKYSGTGLPLWINRHYSEDVDDRGYVHGLAVDSNGDVVVVGSSAEYWAVIKYSSSGSALWTNRFNRGGYAEAKAVAVWTNGDIFVTGIAQTTNSASSDIVAIKYSAAGVPRWTNLYDGPKMLGDFVHGLALDSSGNVLLMGYTVGTNDRAEFVTIKYSNNGAAVWTNYCGGSANQTPNSLAVDGNGNVFVTGGSSDTSGADSIVVAYSSGGMPLWTNRYHGPLGHADEGRDIAAIGVGQVVVLGASFGDFATVKYDSGFALNINSQPLDQINNAGTTAIFSVGISGTAPFTFQWQRNGMNLADGGNISGATTATLTIPGVTTNDVGNYSVVVSNPAGSMTSVVAVLSVVLPNTPPWFHASGVIVSGNNVILSWPTNFAGFTLESTTNLTSPVVWIDVTNPQVVVGGLYTVTNSRSGSAQFFRLSKP